MAILNIKQGESLRLAIKIEGVTISTLTNVEIAINRISYTLDATEITQDPSDDSIFILSLSSATTTNFRGLYPVYLAIDSTTLGVQKSDELLTLNFQPAAPLSSPSTTTTIDAFITATIDTDSIVSDATLAQIMKGDTGAQGPTGTQGPQGLKGDKGDKGDQGEPGTAVNAITSLNNLTATVQTFATGTTGNDVSIVSSGSTHTFNFPDAGAAARGFVNLLAQSFQGAKTFLSEIFTRKITVTGAGTTSSTDALVVRNGALQNTLRVRDDRRVIIDVGSTAGEMSMQANANRFEIYAANLALIAGTNRLDFTYGFTGVFEHYATQRLRNQYNDDRGFTLEVADQNRNPYLSFRNGQNIYFTDAPNTAATAHSYTFFQKSGTPPTISLTDCFAMYAADVAAGNAVPHIRTENGAIIKLYQQTTSTAAATLVANSGTAINSASTFDGYTLPQIVKALRNAGFLQ